MSKADLHVHSRYSEEVTEQFLRKAGFAESYTEPEAVYLAAKSRGMDFVTITDHNRIEGAFLLKERHPEDVIPGVEVTAFFPEDSCKIHTLIYGLNHVQFGHIMKIRNDIYTLRDYIREQELAYSIAHAAYSGSGKLTLVSLEKLILLFDVFETINGGRSRMDNDTWSCVLRSLTPERIDELYRAHRIEPFSATPWIKGFTGGSDDHGGLFIGKTCTVSSAATPEDFIRSLKERKTSAEGSHNDFRSFAFTLGKIAYDFSQTKKKRGRKAMLAVMADMIFHQQPLRFRDKIMLRLAKYRSRRKNDRISGLIVKLAEQCNRPDVSIDRRLDHTYETLALVGDELILGMIRACAKDLAKGNIARIMRDTAGLLSGIFLTAPFLMTFRHLYNGRPLSDELTRRFLTEKKQRRILWFTDSLEETDDVSPVIRHNLKDSAECEIRVATILAGETPASSFRGKVIDLPVMYQFCLPDHLQYPMRVPSLMRALEAIYNYDPDEIRVSTVGPAGILGLLAAQLLRVRTVAFYHPQYHAMFRGMIEAESIAALYDNYTRWWYTHVDEVHVPEGDWTDTLTRKGVSPAKIRRYVMANNSPDIVPHIAIPPSISPLNNSLPHVM